MRRFQFSLRKLLLVIAAVVVVGSHVFTSFKLRKAEHELHDLRIEQGVLVVEDKSKIQVLHVDMQEPMAWRWKVYLPPGREYQALLHYGDVGSYGFPAESVGDWDLWEGENIITAKVQRDERGDWRVMVYTDTEFGRDDYTIPTESADWLQDLSERSYFQSVAITQAFDADVPAELLRISVDDSFDDSSSDPAGRYEGILIWVEEYKPTE